MKNYSNYHETNIVNKIQNDGTLLFNLALDGFEGCEVTIDGVSTKVLMPNKYSIDDGNTKYIIGNTSNIQCGKVVNVDSEKWIITSTPKDYKIYKKAVIQLSNMTLELSGTKTKTQTGTNSFGEPIYSYTQGVPTLLPCIAETTILSDDINEAINLPEGIIQITIPFTEHADLVEGKDFNMYGSKYKIIGIDYTKSINGVGLLVIKGKKV